MPGQDLIRAARVRLRPHRGAMDVVVLRLLVHARQPILLSGADRFCHFLSEEERAGKRAGGPEEPDGLAGKGKAAEFEREGPVSVIAVRSAADNPRCPRVGISW